MNPPRKHLRRLDEVWQDAPVYFVTTGTVNRTPCLANAEFHSIAVEVWRTSGQLYGWMVGRYVIMPDHVHFFAADTRGERSLSYFVGKWKEWTAKNYARRHGHSAHLWQPEFFDHVLRSSESYDQKWDYVRDNPIRASLVEQATDWIYQGELNLLRFD